MALDGNVAARIPWIQERSISPPRTLGIQGRFQGFSLVVEKCNRGPHSARYFAAEGRHGDTVWEILGFTITWSDLALMDWLSATSPGGQEASENCPSVARLKGDRPILLTLSDSKRRRKHSRRPYLTSCPAEVSLMNSGERIFVNFYAGVRRDTTLHARLHSSR